MSSKHYFSLLEDIFKKLNWEAKGINVKCNCKAKGKSPNYITGWLDKTGSKINRKKTKVMTNTQEKL